VSANTQECILKSPWNQNGQFLFFNVILEYLLWIIYQCTSLFILYSCALVIFNQNNFPLLLALLWWRLLAWGRGNLSLTWDRPIANHNYPINSPWTKSSPALHLFLFEKPFHSHIHHNRERKTIATCFMPTLIHFSVCEWLCVPELKNTYDY